MVDYEILLLLDPELAEEPQAEVVEDQVPVDDTPPPEPDDTAGPPPEAGEPQKLL